MYRKIDAKYLVENFIKKVTRSLPYHISGKQSLTLANTKISKSQRGASSVIWMFTSIAGHMLLSWSNGTEALEAIHE